MPWSRFLLHWSPKGLSKKLVSFRLEPEEYRDIERFARANQRTVSNLIRHVLKEWVNYQKKTQKAPRK